jgi:hypothetical protein
MGRRCRGEGKSIRNRSDCVRIRRLHVISLAFGWVTAIIGICCNWEEGLILWFHLKRVSVSAAWRLALLYNFGRRGRVAIADILWL